MSRKRLIDADGLFYDTELVRLLGPKGLLIYIILWTLSEDSGVYQANYDEIALRTGGLRFSAKVVEKIIAKLIEAGKILPFAVNGRTYHYIRNFLKHQKLNHPALPTLPLPPWIICEKHEYKSGKKYAKYEIDKGKLPGQSEDSPRTVPGQQETETETETETEKKHHPDNLKDLLEVVNQELKLHLTPDEMRVVLFNYETQKIEKGMIKHPRAMLKKLAMTFRKDNPKEPRQSADNLRGGKLCESTGRGNIVVEPGSNRWQKKVKSEVND